MKVFDIALKDLTRSVRSLFAIGMMIGAPLVITALIYFAFGGAAQGTTDLPAEKVGGDYFDFMQLDVAHLGVLIADAAGHGIPAAPSRDATRNSTRASSNRPSRKRCAPASRCSSAPALAGPAARNNASACAITWVPDQCMPPVPPIMPPPPCIWPLRVVSAACVQSPLPAPWPAPPMP